MGKTAIENGMLNPKVRKESMNYKSQRKERLNISKLAIQNDRVVKKRGTAVNENHRSSTFYGGSSSYTSLALVYNFITTRW
jgi:hypothetical protein